MATKYDPLDLYAGIIQSTKKKKQNLRWEMTAYLSRDVKSLSI